MATTLGEAPTMGHMMGGPFDGIWMLGTAALVATPLAAIAVMWFRRGPRHNIDEPSPQLCPGDQAIEQLKVRYAEGRIDTEELEQRLETVLRH